MNESRQCILLVDDDRGITEALSYALECPGRMVVICSDVESAETALARYPITHLVTDVQFSGTFGFEGLHFLGRVRSQAPGCRIVLITGYATDQLRAEALRHGASEVLAKPFDIDELESALGAPAVSDSAYDVIRIPPIEEILTSDAISPVFQPIVRLTESGISSFGFEALTRVRGRWLAGGPVMLFEYAAKREKLVELNIVAMTRAIEAAPVLPEEASLFINIDPLAFNGKQLVPALTAASKRAMLPLERIVLEVTERSAFSDDEVAGRVFDELRALGLRFALDDHGSAYSHLNLINRIQPSFIKVSQTFGTAFENDATKERIVRHTVALARDFGCELILEGVESSATARAAVSEGVTLAQGFHFGRPRAAGHWVTVSSKSALRAA
ncbi:MAG TPA: EAL domain-containing protein [Thermoanaerobaculia bacterium]|jgi:EAL domain-containing protein (putative c-di-GMP-specific phosphodiesterase class I)/ActR/RegA family two-component response regulator